MKKKPKKLNKAAALIKSIKIYGEKNKKVDELIAKLYKQQNKK